MQDKARFFAYATWVTTISLGTILFTHLFFPVMYESIFLMILISLCFGFLYFNLTYASIKRYIRKVPAPTNSHIALAVLVFIPPGTWLLIMNQPIQQNDLLLFVLLILSSICGTIYGNRAGIKARFEFVQKLKEYQNEMRKRSE
jgi:CDP-diglyceride synthetase